MKDELRKWQERGEREGGKRAGGGREERNNRQVF